MNLREKIEKEITDKVMTKLASERVELNLMAKLEESEYELSRSTADFAQLVNDFTTKAKKEKQRIEKVLKIAKSQADDAVKKIKEVGLNPNDLPVNKKLRKSAAQLGLDLPNDIQKIGDFSNQLSNLKDFANDVK